MPTVGLAFAALVGLLAGGAIAYRAATFRNNSGKGWREFLSQLLPAVVVGLGIIFFAYHFLEERDGVVVVGVAIVEIVWAALGGSPIDRSLEALSHTTTALKTDFRTEMETISDQFASARRQFGAACPK
jgi:ABC-type Fe3+ transport system permease subunit